MRLALCVLVGCGSKVEAAGDAGDASSDGLQDHATMDVEASDANHIDLDAGQDADALTPIALHLKCAEGDQCDATAPVCCATLDFGSNCVLDAVSAACAASSDCPTTLEPFCTPTETVRFCDENADCTEPSYDRCCTFQITGVTQSLVMCASAAMASAVDASCAP